MSDSENGSSDLGDGAKLPPYVQRLRRKDGYKYRGWAVIAGKTVVGSSRDTPEEAHADGVLMREEQAILGTENGSRPPAHHMRLRELINLLAPILDGKRGLDLLERETELMERRDRLRRQRGQGSRLHKPGFIYFIADTSTDLVKIGLARSVKARLGQMMTDNPSESLEVLYSFRGTRETESLLHDAFAEHRVRGEWFKLADSIRQFIQLRAERDERRASQ